MLPIEKQEEDALSFGLRCYYCEILLNPYTQNQRDSKTLDHIIPQSRGGNNKRYNKIHCCSQCNHLKDDLQLHEFLEKVMRLLATSTDPFKIRDYRYDTTIVNIKNLMSYKRKYKKKMLRINETVSQSSKSNS